MNARGDTCWTKDELCRGKSRILFALHNFIMWFIWVVGFFIILCSARYFRQYWKRSIYIHTTFGLILFAVFIAGMVFIRKLTFDKYGQFAMLTVWSSLLENIVTVLAYFIFFSGMISWFYRRYGNY